MRWAAAALSCAAASAASTSWTSAPRITWRICLPSTPGHSMTHPSCQVLHSAPALPLYPYLTLTALQPLHKISDCTNGGFVNQLIHLNLHPCLAASACTI